MRIARTSCRHHESPRRIRRWQPADTSQSRETSRRGSKPCGTRSLRTSHAGRSWEAHAACIATARTSSTCGADPEQVDGGALGGEHHGAGALDHEGPRHALDEPVDRNAWEPGTRQAYHASASASTKASFFGGLI